MKKRNLVIVGLMACCIFTGCGSGNSDVKDTTKEVVTEATEDTSETTTQKETEETSESTSNESDEDTSETTNEVEESTTEANENDSTEKDAEEGNITGIQADIVTTNYAGDTLVASDFSVKLVKEDGTVINSPNGWSASPLKLKEGENKITVKYEEYSTVITYTATKKPEGVTSEGEVGPLVSVNPDAFAVSGSSVLGETPDMGQEYLDKIVFLGDSRTYSYKFYEVLSGGKNTTQVWTPRSGTMTLASQGYAMIYYPETGTDITIRDAVKLKQPEYMVIGLGTNGVSFMTEESFKAEYRALINDIKRISPNTKVMINSIFPVANYYERLDLINNKKIAEANQWLVEVAEETGAKYLNTAEVLVDEQGWLNINYDNGGGATHLNKLGDEIVMQYIRTHGYK
ncbi:MAG: SGNH/GDSL hydrolase family protein [Lachnospiraceae bacterium]|nr:SGNH/GDSL hydrolase family protein [Lachnospiraceae bacterium]